MAYPKRQQVDQGEEKHKCICQIWSGYTVLLGGVLINLALGTLYTWGNVSIYFISYMRHVQGLSVRLKDTVWVMAASFSAQALFMPLGGYAEKFLGPFWSSVTGCTVMSLGVFMSQWGLQNFIFFVLTYGFIFGAGMGFAYTIPITCALKWFPERKGLISGIITAGFGAGALIFNQFQTFYVNSMNKSATIIPYSDQPSERYFGDEELLHNVPKLLCSSSVLYLILQLCGCLLLRNPPSITSASLSKEKLNIKKTKLSSTTPGYSVQDTSSALSKSISSQQDENDPKSTYFIDSSLSDNAINTFPCTTSVDVELGCAVKTTKFWYIWFMFFFNGLAISFVSSFWKAIPDNRLLSDRFLSIIGSISSLCNASGRIFWGRLSDYWDYCYVIAILSSFWGTIVYFLSLWNQNFIFYGVLVCFNFFCLGGNFACFPAITASTFGNANLGMIYGFIFYSQLLASIIMALLSHSLFLLIGITGLSCFVGCCCLLTTIFALRLKKL